MEKNANHDRVQQRIKQEQQDQLAARALEKNSILLEIPRVCKLIVAELDRLDWPDAILQGDTVLYAVNHSSAVAMDGEIYMLRYEGDGEYGTQWTHFTNLKTLAPPSFFLSILESKLADLRSQ